MTAKIDGTNGLLQSYDYQVLTTGFTYTFAAGTQVLVINPAGTLATGTITMPALPADGMTVTFSSTQIITALTIAGNGATVSNTITALAAGQAMAYIYRAASTTWFPYVAVPYVAVPGSQLVSGTAVTLTTQTNVDFTGIPSWVKRITVMFSGVSTSATANIIVQLGTGATPTYTTSGYLGTNTTQTGTADSFTTGFMFVSSNAAASVWHGSMVITNVTSNTWSESSILGNSNAQGVRTSGGSIPLAAALTAVRVTTSSTDTFDLGSINILYE